MLLALVFVAGTVIPWLHFGGGGIPPIVLANPVTRTLATLCGSASCTFGAANSTFATGVEGGVSETSLSSCTVTCTFYRYLQFFLDHCSSGNDLAIKLDGLALTNDTGMFHTATPTSTSNRLWDTGITSACAAITNGSDTEAIYTNPFDATWQSELTSYTASSTNVPTSAVFSDSTFNAPQGGSPVELGTPYLWSEGGTLGKSFGEAVASVANTIGTYQWLFNGPGYVTITASIHGCITVTSTGTPDGKNGCVGDSHNPGMYDNAYYFGEICTHLNQANISVRNEAVLTPNNDTSGAPQSTNMGEALTDYLNGIFAVQNTYASSCGKMKFYLQDSNAWRANPTNAVGYWIAPALLAMSLLAPSSDGTNDQLVPQPYSYGFDNGATNDHSGWPEWLITASGGSVTPAYNINSASLTSAHNATGCPSGAGAIAPQQGESGGSISIGYTCAATAQPVLFKTYPHCWYGGTATPQDLGPCRVYLNTSTTISATVSTTGYNYQISFSGCELGNTSSIPGVLSSALTTVLGLNTNITCNGGTLAFISPTTSLTALNSGGTNGGGVEILTTQKPTGF